MSDKRPVVIMGDRNWRWLWLRRKRRKVRLVPPPTSSSHVEVFSDPYDKERRTRGSE